MFGKLESIEGVRGDQSEIKDKYPRPEGMGKKSLKHAAYGENEVSEIIFCYYDLMHIHAYTWFLQNSSAEYANYQGRVPAIH